jgi:hypothetical protein
MEAGRLGKGKAILFVMAAITTYVKTKEAKLYFFFILMSKSFSTSATL